MIVALKIFGILCAIGLVSFFWAIYKAPVLDDNGKVINPSEHK